ncbi:hypothetical protein QTP88_021335 [Uroleucon formosanum]
MFVLPIEMYTDYSRSPSFSSGFSCSSLQIKCIFNYLKLYADESKMKIYTSVFTPVYTLYGVRCLVFNKFQVKSHKLQLSNSHIQNSFMKLSNRFLSINIL